MMSLISLPLLTGWTPPMVPNPLRGLLQYCCRATLLNINQTDPDKHPFKDGRNNGQMKEGSHGESYLRQDALCEVETLWRKRESEEQTHYPM